MSPCSDDVYGLARFVEQQDARGTYESALSELRQGRKIGHWMWFVFPQLAGLGRSWMSTRFAISSLAEAEAYLAHPTLGPRLIECAHILTQVAGRSAQDIFGSVDAMKLRSSMTLFAATGSDVAVFQQVLDDYFDGVGDSNTEALLRAG